MLAYPLDTCRRDVYKYSIEKFSVHRYFEGQFTTISEADDELASEPSHMRVTDAAEQVHYYLILLSGCSIYVNVYVLT